MLLQAEDILFSLLAIMLLPIETQLSEVLEFFLISLTSKAS